MTREHLIEIATVGLPFCGFKPSTGTVWASPVLLAWGGLDLLLNLINAGALIVVGKRAVPVCASAALAAWFLPKRSAYTELGLASDMALSFVLVAWMVGSGAVAHFPPLQRQVWNGCVVINVLGAGLGRWFSAYHAARRDSAQN